MKQPDKDYHTPDLRIFEKEVQGRTKKERERINKLNRKRRARQKSEQAVRDMWINLTQEEQQKRAERLERVCNQLIKHHPRYKQFHRARVFFPVFDDEGIMCVIHWNGKKLEKESGWGMLDREFPAHDIPLIIKKYNDKLRNFTEDDEI